MVHRQFLGPRKVGEEASHSQVCPTEPVANEIRTAVGKLAVKPVKLRFQL